MTEEEKNLIGSQQDEANTGELTWKKAELELQKTQLSTWIHRFSKIDEEFML